MDRLTKILDSRRWFIFWLLWDVTFAILDVIFCIRRLIAREWGLALFFGVMAALMLWFARWQWQQMRRKNVTVIGIDPTPEHRARILLPLDPLMIKEFDFSEFHPLDHPWWLCMGYPGGLRRHLQLWHDYQAPDPIGALLCLVGRHEWVKAWMWRDTEPDGQALTVCSRCWKERH